MPVYLDPSVLRDPTPAANHQDDEAPDEGIIHDGLGIPRVAFRCWTERRSDPVEGSFLLLHRAAVWDAAGQTIESRPAATREAALNEALGCYLATAGGAGGSRARR